MSRPALDTVEQIMNAYLDSRVGQVTAFATLQAVVRGVIATFGKYTLKEICEPYVLQTMCRKYAAECRDAQNTIRKRLSVFQAALRWSWKEFHTPLPVMWIPPVPQTSDRTLSDEERESLLAAADKQID